MQKRFSLKKLIMCIVLSASILFLCSGIQPLQAFAEGGTVITTDFFDSNSTVEVIRITKNVVEIQDGAFSGLTCLRRITVDSDNMYYASYDGCLYNKDYTVLICIPQNTNSVHVKTSITSYTPHALDGLAQSRIDTLNNFLSNRGVIVSNPVTTYTPPIENPTPIISEPSPTPQNSTDFSQYVYTNRNGEQEFRYTGSGDSRIIIPEGVKVVAGFTKEIGLINYDITYVYVPSTVVEFKTSDMFYEAEFGWDSNMYNVLYQCPNLQTVEGGNFSYQCNSNTVTRPGNITVWSNSAKYPFDWSQYQNFNNNK